MADQSSASSELRKGWSLVVASAAGMSLSPLLPYHIGLFIVPLENEFGWGRALITSGLAVNAVVAVLLSAAFGWLIDRLGPRRIAIPGVILFCALFASLASVSGSALHWWLLWLGLSVCALMVKPTVWAKAIASRFDRSRGLALAVMLSGSGLTGIFAPLIAGFLIGAYGWRVAYVGLAAVYFAVTMPLVVAFFYSSSDQDRQRPAGAVAEPPVMPTGSAVNDAFRSPTFWKLALAVLLATTVVTGTVVHFVPLAIQFGIAPAKAGILVSVIGIAALSGRMVTGVLLDRINAKYIGGVAFALPAIAFGALLASGGTFPALVAVAILVGLASGAEFEIATYLISRFFGLRNFGTLFGFITGFAALATGLGAPLAGLAFDRLGSYDLAADTAVALSILSSLLILSLPRNARQEA